MALTVDIKYAINLLRIGVAQGYDLPYLLESTGFDFDPLAANHSHSTVSAEQYTSLSNQIGRLLQDECFGFYADFSVPCGTFQMMCYAVIPCTTLHAAIIRMNQFSQMCANIRGQNVNASNPITFARNSEIVSYSDPHLKRININKSFRSQYAIAGTLSSWHRFCSWLIGMPIELAEVTFEGEREIDEAESQRYFDCQHSFGQPTNSLNFHRRFLDMPLRQSESSLETFLKMAPYQLGPQREAEKQDDTIEDKIRLAIGYNFSIPLPSFDQIAGQLSIPSRTLRRQLEALGKTYRQIKDEQRKEAVLDLLARPELELNAIAPLMGFDEPSAFHRAFKNWFNVPPGQYREQHWGQKSELKYGNSAQKA